MFKADEWKTKIAEFKQSEMSQIAWCKAQGSKYYLLKYWFYRLHDLERKTIPFSPYLKS